MKLKLVALIAALMVCTSGLIAQHNSELNLNKPEREKWFTDLGLGLLSTGVSMYNWEWSFHIL